MKIFRFFTICLLAFVLAGCVGFNTINATSNRTTTIGQEITDLQAAKDSGAITEEEYVKGKEKLMKMIDNPDAFRFCNEKKCK